MREIAVVRAGTNGAPPRAGHRLVRFRVSRHQVAAGLQHAKLYREWAVRSPETGWHGDDRRPLERLPGSGGDASGVYRASFFIPRNVRWTHAWGNVMQFKLVFPTGGGAVGSEPQWWLDLVGAGAWRHPPRRPDGTRSRRGDPVLVVSNWTERRADGRRNDWPSRLVAPPVGRWFEISASLRQGVGIQWSLDGRPWFRAAADDWPVGLTPTPTHPAADASGWIFGVGLYGAPGRIYTDAASFTPPG